MKVTALLREQLQQAHQFVGGLMADVTPEQIHWCPQGNVNTLAGNYAHILLAEDLVINALLKGGAPFFVSTWAGKTGMSTLPPLPTPERPGLPPWRDWSTQMQTDLNALQAYAQAVYAASDDYLASLPDEELSRSLDLSVIGLGTQSVK